MLYDVVFRLGRERRVLQVRAEDADTAYDLARFELADRFPSASIQGKATPVLHWAEPSDDPFGEH